MFEVCIGVTLAILPSSGNETTRCLDSANGSAKRGNQCQWISVWQTGMAQVQRSYEGFRDGGVKIENRVPALVSGPTLYWLTSRLRKDVCRRLEDAHRSGGTSKSAILSTWARSGEASQLGHDGFPHPKIPT